MPNKTYFSKKKYRILILLVLYKKLPTQSETFTSLLSVINTELFNRYFEVLLYDHSPKDSNAGNKELKNFKYIHDPANKGLSHAYNFGYQYSKKNNLKYIMLLDHDTNLTLQYFENLIYAIDTSTNEIAAYIPKVWADNKMISPIKINFIRSNPIKVNYYGRTTERIVGINSGTVLSIDFIKSINGFNNNFPFDMLDYWYFNEIYIRKKPIYILNVSISHDLSVLNYNKSVSLNRYKKILKSEMDYYRKFHPSYFYTIYKFRLIYRITKQIKYVNKNYSILTFKYLLRHN